MHNIKPERTITGTIKCKNCDTEIKWHYVFRHKEFGMYSYSIPTNTRCATKVDDKENIYYVRCINCDKKIYFQYIED